MAKTVFILGAGASKKAGGPLMKDFLDKARDIYDSGRAGDAKDAFELVFKARAQIKAAHSMAQVDIDNIEHVFATFEMAEILGRLGSLSEMELKQLGPAIRELIHTTIEMEILFRDNRGSIYAPEPYDNVNPDSYTFCKLLRGIRDDQDSSPCVITFNYDLALDYSLHRNGIPFDYALPEMPVREGDIPILKLHGSLNWAKCDGCEGKKTSFWLPKKAFSTGGWAVKSSRRVVIDSSEERNRSCVNCKKALDRKPQIVPPTWNKAQHYTGIESVWQRAAKELSQAENIFIIGYSWPPNDHFFNSLYSLGTISEDTYFKRLWVFNPDKNLYEHFRKLLGQTAEERFRFYSAEFQDAIGMMRTVLLQKKLGPEQGAEKVYRVMSKPNKDDAD